jgi:hypothetical protein
MIILLILGLLNISLFITDIYLSKYFGKNIKKWWERNICKEVDYDK